VVKDDHEVVRRLREAFMAVRPSPSYRGQTSDLPSDALSFLSQDIFSLNDEDAHFFLPQILIGLCENQPSESARTEEARTIASYLNYAGSKENYDWMASEFGKKAAHYARTSDEYLERYSQDRFAQFSAEQAAAIVEWLKCAMRWNIFKSDQREIEAAISYWSERANR
jgi:hypothetical protein